jgi:hypothetical protein
LSEKIPSSPFSKGERRRFSKKVFKKNPLLFEKGGTGGIFRLAFQKAKLFRKLEHEQT